MVSFAAHASLMAMLRIAHVCEHPVRAKEQHTLASEESDLHVGVDLN